MQTQFGSEDLERKDYLWELQRRRNIKWILDKQAVDWIRLAQDRVRGHADEALFFTKK